MKRNTLLNALLLAAVGFGLTATAQAQNAKVGSVQIENAYTRATVPGQMAAGGFMKIENKGAADQLISASSPVSGEVQLHEMAMEGNVMKMRQVKDIPIPAGGSVELKPGGYHLMFINIKCKPPGFNSTAPPAGTGISFTWRIFMTLPSIAISCN